jgi:hypothetical protein
MNNPFQRKLIAKETYQYVEDAGRKAQKRCVVRLIEDGPLPAEIIATFDAGLPNREGVGDPEALARAVYLAEAVNNYATLTAQVEAQAASLEECRVQLVRYVTLREAVLRLLPTLAYNAPPAVFEDLHEALRETGETPAGGAG